MFRTCIYQSWSRNSNCRKFQGLAAAYWEALFLETSNLHSSGRSWSTPGRFSWRVMGKANALCKQSPWKTTLADSSFLGKTVFGSGLVVFLHLLLSQRPFFELSRRQQNLVAAVILTWRLHLLFSPHFLLGRGFGGGTLKDFCTETSPWQSLPKFLTWSYMNQ